MSELTQPGATRLLDPAKILRFAFVSGSGLLLDLAVFLALLSIDVPPFFANLTSNTCAVTFVYLASVSRVFRYDGRFQIGMFTAYLTYQAGGILAGSWAVKALIAAGLMPALSKLAILPLTFGANYLFMCWLTAKPERWSRETRG